MPEKCKTPDCKNPVKYPRKGLCKPCYQRDWSATRKKSAPSATPKAKPAPSARVQASTDGKAFKPLPSIAPEGTDVATPGHLYAGLTNADLASHITAALSERSKRLAGVDVLRDVVSR
ncbi:MAG: hypothetical protein HY901_15020 [Deltaproteobacteria bacterium]|nr:hypothetical protein [Deltaproteobacteria bacterium]